MKKTTLVFIIFLLLLLTSCSGVTRELTPEVVSFEGGSYTNITPAQLEKELEEGDFLLLNVFGPIDQEIPGTDLTILHNEIQTYEDLLPADKNERIIVYCRSGNKSDYAAKTLVLLGYTDVWNLDGGFTAWQQAGYPMVASP